MDHGESTETHQHHKQQQQKKNKKNKTFNDVTLRVIKFRKQDKELMVLPCGLKISSIAVRWLLLKLLFSSVGEEALACQQTFWVKFE